LDCIQAVCLGYSASISWNSPQTQSEDVHASGRLKGEVSQRHVAMSQGDTVAV